MLTKRLDPRHAARRARHNLYMSVRHYLKLSREKFCALTGLSIHTLIYRERCKVLYNTHEVVELYELSGMTPDEFMRLLKDIS